MRSLLLLFLLPGTAWAVPRDAVEAIARAHLATRGDLARGGELRLERVRDWGAAKFRRYQRGVPVIGGVVSVRVEDGGDVAGAWSDPGVVPDGLDVTPAVPASEAVRLASKGASDEAGQALLVVLAMPGRRARLAWEVDLPLDLAKGTAWRVLVDANDGSLLARQSLVASAKRAKVFAGGSPLKGGLTEVTLDLPDGATRLANDRFVAFNCIDRQTCGVKIAGADARSCVLEPKAKADASGDFLYDRPASDTALEDEFAEVQMFYHATRVFARFKELGLDALNRTPLNTYVNMREPDVQVPCDPGAALNTIDNAYYYGGSGRSWPPTAAMVFGQGEDIDYAYDGDVVYHELTHGVQHVAYGDHFFGAYTDEYGLNLDGVAMGEATADYFSVSISGDPVLGEYSLGTAYERDLSHKYVCPRDIVGEEHDDSRMFSSALYDARMAFPEAQRLTFDKAVLRGMDAFGDTESFDSAQKKIMTELRLLAGDAAVTTASAKIHEHGIDGCNQRVADLASGAAWPELWLQGTQGATITRAPASVQWRLMLDKPYDHILVTMRRVINGASHQRGQLRMVAKVGSGPILWDPDAVTHDGKPDTPIATTGTLSSLVPGPFPAGPVVLELVQDGANLEQLIIQDIAFRPDTPMFAPDAGAGGGGAGGDGGGCAVSGRSGGAWLLALALLALARRRRR